MKAPLLLYNVFYLCKRSIFHFINFLIFIFLFLFLVLKRVFRLQLVFLNNLKPFILKNFKLI